MSPPFSISPEPGQTIVIRVKNLINETLIREILQSVDAWIEGGITNFVVDLTELRYMNSVGLNLLIALKKRAEARGGLAVVAAPPPKIIELLEITKLRPLLRTADSVPQALEAIETAAN